MKPFLLAISFLLCSQLLANDVTEERIVFIRDTTEIWAHGEIWTTTPNGSDQRLLWDDSQNDLATSGLLSPDGKWLFYQTQNSIDYRLTAHLRNLVTGQEFEYRYFEFHGTQWLFDSSGLVATANNDCRGYLPVLFNLDGTVTELSNPDLGQKGNHVFGIGIEANTFFVLIQDCASSSGSYEIQKYNFLSGEREFIGIVNFPHSIASFGSETSWDGKWIYFEAMELIDEQPKYSTQRFSTESGDQELVFDFFPRMKALSPDGTEMIHGLNLYENRIYDVFNKSYRTIPVEGVSTDWSFLVTSAPPVFHKFLSSETLVAIGESFDLHWQVGDASECDGLGDWSGAKGTEGSETITVNTVGTKIYQLSCTNLLNETRSQTISIAVQVSWEDCVPANIYLTNQAEVDALSVSGCTAVKGDLDITGSIASLDGLSNLTSVSGNLTIHSNYALTSLVGLTNLAYVGGELKIENNTTLTSLNGLTSITSLGKSITIYKNAALTNLVGLANLTSVGGSILLWNNAALTNIDGLINLSSVGGFLYFKENAALTNLDGLASLTYLGGKLSITFNGSLTNLDGLINLTSVGDGGLTIHGNDSLTSLDGLVNLTSVVGGLGISGNTALTNLDGLSSITGVVGGLSIYGNDSLTSLDGLSNITGVGRGLEIGGNVSLTSLDGLSNITNLGGYLRIAGNVAVTNLDGLSNITSVGEHMWISSNAALTSLDGLSNITSVGGSLSISGNAVLTDLDGLSNITSMGGDLQIKSNTTLTNLAGLSNLSSVVGNLDISANAALTNLDGLSKIISVTGYLWIVDNNALTNVDGLANLTSVGGHIWISSNAALTNLNGLVNLTSVGGGLAISGNAVLTNLDGLSSLTSVGSILRITDNPELDQCLMLSRLLDQWDDAEPGPGPGDGGFPDIGWGAEIRDNLIGCNSVEEILANAKSSQINPGLNDAWYYPETSGQGFFITVFPDLGYVSLAWFTYDTELPPIGATANLGDPGHRWLTAVGLIEDNQVLMDIEMTSGGIFDAATEIIRTDPPGSDGTILLNFTSCRSGTVEYDIPSINRQGIIPIQRVANDNIALCEALNSN